MVLLVMFVLMSSVGIAEPLTVNKPITSSSQTSTGIKITNPELIGQTVVSVNQDVFYARDSNGNINGYARIGDGIYNSNARRVDGSGPESYPGIRMPPSQPEGNAVNYYTPPQTGSAASPATNDYIYFSDSGLYTTYRVTNNGQTYTMSVGGVLVNGQWRETGGHFQYTDNSVLANVDWSKQNLGDMQAGRVQTESGTVIDVSAASNPSGNPIGLDGSTYVAVRADGTRQTNRYQGGNRVVVSDQNIETVNGQPYTITTDYEQGTVTVPGALVGRANDVTFDSTFYESGRSPDWTTTRTIHDGNLYFSENERMVARPGGLYFEQNRVSGNWRDTRRLEVKDISDPAAGAGRQRTVTDLSDNSQLIQQNYGNGNLVINQRVTSAGTTTSLTIQRAGQDDINLQGETARHYLGNRNQVNPATAREIAFAYENLGSDGVFNSGNGQYKDSAGRTVVPSAGRITYTDRLGDQEILFTQDVPNVDLGGNQRFTVNSGDRVSLDYDGNTIAGAVVTDGKGHVRAVQDEGALTTFSGDANNPTYTTQYHGVTYSQPNDDGIVTTKNRVVGTPFRSFDSHGNPVVYVNNEPIDAADVLDAQGNRRPEYQNVEILDRPNGDPIAPSQLTRANINRAKDEARPAVLEQDDAVAEQESAEREMRRQARMRSQYPGLNYGAWYDLISIYQMYRPLNEISNLLLTSTNNEAWLESVDSFFARNYLGVDYWASDLCRSWFDYEFTEDGNSAVIETPGGMVQFVGRVEGERSDPVPVVCTTDSQCTDLTGDSGVDCTANVCEKNGQVMSEHFYKITYSVIAPADLAQTTSNNEDQALTFNILIKGPSRSVPLFKEMVSVPAGNLVSDFFIQYSSNVYDEVCLLFGEKPRTARPGSGPTYTTEICNTLVGSDRNAVNFGNNPDSGTGDSGAGGGFNTI